MHYLSINKANHQASYCLENFVTEHINKYFVLNIEAMPLLKKCKVNQVDDEVLNLVRNHKHYQSKIEFATK